ncbi:zinc metalloproteinase-disintegrin-like lachestatin-2 [Pseudophryne corroboree]|uniref:zinc metalloproteinase-disintegrin-like lachestatin-2 n=1 Tax=Pseudophryne corroboree TaxID=495146 RepID=UPI0030815234
MLRPALLLLVLLEFPVLAFNRIPAGQKYKVVFPKKLHAQHKRDTQGKHPDLVQYGIQLNGKHVVLHLEKTENLISENYTETYYLEDGTPVTSSPQEQDHCYYQGHVKNDSRSQVSLSACHGLSGMIMTEEQKFLIEPLNVTENGAHAVYSYQAQETPKTCGVDDTTFNETIMTKTALSSTDEERQEFMKAKKYIQLYMVADYSMFIKYKRNKEEIKKRIFGIVNFVNQVYKQINTFVALIGMEIWDTRDQFQVVSSPSSNLDLFSKWRTEILLPRKDHDNAQFLTDIDFDGTTVGLAWIATLCSRTHSSGVNQDHSKDYITVGATVAHEMGHNLGMNHDDNACGCNTCVMAPVLSYDPPRKFSFCSHQHYASFLQNQMPLCTKDMPEKGEILSTPVCGNGFTEREEECDCGTVEECKNTCCDAATCKLKQDAQCAEGECCLNCQLKKAGSVCRSAKDECDLPDMCDGKSNTCPSDRLRVNGFPCSNGQGRCYYGTCPTHKSQCEKYWGPGSDAADDDCFENNRRSNRGYCLQSGTQIPCAAKDVKCGVFYCKGGTSRPILNVGYYSYSSRCKSLYPFELVETGTLCGEESVCTDGKCMSMENAYRATNCSAKCPGHEVCNDKMECQCEEGGAPYNCNTRADFNYGYIALIVVILLIIIVAGFLLYKRTQRRKQRRPAATASGVTNPTFNIQNRTQPAPLSYPSTPQAYQKPISAPPSRPAYPPFPSQTQVNYGNAAYPPQPPSQSQKPQVPNAYQKPSTAPPSRPAYPPIPPQVLKPNLRR